MFFRFPPDARWNPVRGVVEFGIGIGEYEGSARWNAVRREWAQGEQAARRVTIAEIKRERSSESAPAFFPRPEAIRPLGEPRALS